MTRKRSKDTEAYGPPVEIPMTDLGYDQGDDDRPNRLGADIHAAGTPGGGTAAGGLAGSNAGEGNPEFAELEDAFGSGIHDDVGDEADSIAYGGHAGGAVGGTPAGRRARGGRPEGNHGGLNPGDKPPSDRTLGSRPDERT